MQYDNNNVFAKLLRGELSCKKVYEDDEVLAFYDIHPKAPIHVLVIPKGPFCSYHEFISRNSPEQIGQYFKVVAQIAEQLGCSDHGYRLVINQGEDGGQEVPHFHTHILAGKSLAS